MRLDQYLKEHAYFESRHKASIAIKNGAVSVNDRVVKKPSFLVPLTPKIEFVKSVNPYVSQGGLKLEKAIHDFIIDFNDKTVLDIGASSGGFTDCAIVHGAKKVFALDVGTNQLHPKIKDNTDVIVMENTNFLATKHHEFRDIDITVCDVSFISGLKILNHLNSIGINHEIVILIKPQFESLNTPKSGVIKNPKMHVKILRHYLDSVVHMGFTISGLTPSPIKGQSGNKEFLLYLGTKELNIEIDTLIKTATSLG